MVQKQIFIHTASLTDQQQQSNIPHPHVYRKRGIISISQHPGMDFKVVPLKNFSPNNSTETGDLMLLYVWVKFSSYDHQKVTIISLP